MLKGTSVTIGIYLVVMFLLPLSVSAQNGSTLLRYLTPDGPEHHTDPVYQGGGEDTVSLNGLVARFDNDNSGTLTDGDDLVFMSNITTVFASGRQVRSLSGDEKIVVLLAYEFQGNNLIPVADGPAALENILHPSISEPAGLTEDSVGVILTGIVDSSDPMNNPTNFTVEELSTLFSNDNGWKYEAALGFDSDADDFSQLEDQVAGYYFHRGGHTVQSTSFDNNGWLKVDAYDIDYNIRLADFTINFVSLQTASEGEQSRGWSYFTNGWYHLNLMPLERSKGKGRRLKIRP